MSARESLAADPEARRARRRPTLVRVRFAEEAGYVETLEGPVQYQAGDAIVRGEAGESWPVGRERFLASHEPAEGFSKGEDGIYRRRCGMVLAKRLAGATEVVLSGARGTLRGDAGDWLVEYAPGDSAIVAADIFERTYELLPD